MILLDAKTRNVPQFISASQCNFETIDLGIESSVPLASDGNVNPSDTIVLTLESLHHSQPPCIKESPRCSKCILRLIFKGSLHRDQLGY